MRKFVVILFPVFSSSLYAQESDGQKGWAVTLAAAAIPISQPGVGIQPGVEYRFNDRLSLLAEITIPVNKKNSKDSLELNKKYLRYKTEIRYTLVTKKGHYYTGLQLSSSQRKFTNVAGFYYNERHTDSVYYYDKAFINSPVTTVSVQFGSIVTKGRFAVDIFAGIGARFIHTSISDIENPVRSTIRQPDSGLSLTASYSYKGTITMFHFNGGIRFMWHFYEFKSPRKMITND